MRLPESLFDRRFEYLFSAICVVGLGLCALELFQLFRLNTSQAQTGHIVVNVLFLGNSHVLFTPIYLLFTHPGRQWALHSTPPFKVQTSIIFLVPALISGICYYFLWEQGREWFRGFYYAASAYHIGRQTWGFQRLTQAKFDGPEVPPPSSHSFLVGILILLNCVLQFAFIRPNPIPPGIRMGLLIALSVGVAGLILRLCWQRSSWSSRVYAARTWTFFPLQHVSSFAFYSHVLLHAAEYLFVTLKLFAASQKVQKRSFIYFAAIIGLFAIVASFRLLDLPPFRQHLDALLTHRVLPSVLIGVSFGFSFLHFWLDAFLFTRTNAGTRKHIIPSIWARSG